MTTQNLFSKEILCWQFRCSGASSDIVWPLAMVFLTSMIWRRPRAGAWKSEFPNRNTTRHAFIGEEPRQERERDQGERLFVRRDKTSQKKVIKPWNQGRASLLMRKKLAFLPFFVCLFIIIIIIIIGFFMPLSIPDRNCPDQVTVSGPPMITETIT